MKTLLLFLALASVVRADQWLVNGARYNGTIHKLNPARTMVFVTSDWDNYGGSWLRVETLDAATRVKLGIATPQEQIAVHAANERARQEAERRAQEQREAAAILAAQRALRIEEQKLALQRAELELKRQRQQQRTTITNNTYIVPSLFGRGYGTYNPGGTSGTYIPRVPRVPQVPAVPSVPQVPQVPVVPQVQPVQPIVLWYN